MYYNLFILVSVICGAHCKLPGLQTITEEDSSHENIAHVNTAETIEVDSLTEDIKFWCFKQ